MRINAGILDFTVRIFYIHIAGRALSLSLSLAFIGVSYPTSHSYNINLRCDIYFSCIYYLQVHQARPARRANEDH